MKSKTMEGKEKYWRKELEEAYKVAASVDDCSDTECLIRRAISLLKEQRQELKKKVEGMKKHGDVALGWGELTPEEWDYNETLDKVLTLLEELKE